MTLHDRQQIREAVKAALIGAHGDPVQYATAAGARVYETRVVPFRRLELPAVAVYSLSETSDDEETAPRVLKRSLQLVVEAAVQQGDNVDDALDAISAQIETAMHRDPTFGGVASDSTLSSTRLDVYEEGERITGVAVMQYAVTYYTAAPAAADVTLDDLETVGIQTSLGGAQAEADRAVDSVSFVET